MGKLTLENRHRHGTSGKVPRGQSLTRSEVDVARPATNSAFVLR
jgi:hypothetical protein